MWMRYGRAPLGQKGGVTLNFERGQEMKDWGCGAAVLLALAVALGAFGAHALAPHLDTRAQEVYKTANFYHFIHALGLLALVALPEPLLAFSQRTAVAVLLAIGILVFCGSLYALALSGVRILGAITPIGGICFIAAWCILAWRLRFSAS